MITRVSRTSNIVNVDELNFEWKKQQVQSNQDEHFKRLNIRTFQCSSLLFPVLLRRIPKLNVPRFVGRN